MDVLNYLRNEWDRVGAWVCIAGGAVALLLGWLGVSDTAFPAEQIPYIISGGLVGVFLLGIGGILWLSADLRDEWRKLDAIERHLAAGAPLPVDEAAPPNGQRDLAPIEIAEVEDARPARRRRSTRSQ